MFLPNIVFMLWFLHGNKKKLLRLDTWAKVIVAGSIQLVTIIKYVYWYSNILKQALDVVLKLTTYKCHSVVSYNLHSFSFILGMVMAFKPNGFYLGGTKLTKDTTIGNLNFFKCAEGFLESFPQSIYQLSIVLRTAKGNWLVKHY